MKSAARMAVTLFASSIVCAAPAAFGRQAGETAVGTVLFAADSDQITPQGAKVLDGVAARFKDSKTQIIVRGHSEPTEHAAFGPEYGFGLAHRRAGNVVSYLVERGVKPDAVAARAFGDSRPIKGAPPATLRRVEIVLETASSK